MGGNLQSMDSSAWPEVIILLVFLRKIVLGTSEVTEKHDPDQGRGDKETMLYHFMDKTS